MLRSTIRRDGFRCQRFLARLLLGFILSFAATVNVSMVAAAQAERMPTEPIAPVSADECWAYWEEATRVIQRSMPQRVELLEPDKGGVDYNSQSCEVRPGNYHPNYLSREVSACLLRRQRDDARARCLAVAQRYQAVQRQSLIDRTPEESRQRRESDRSGSFAQPILRNAAREAGRAYVDSTVRILVDERLKQIDERLARAFSFGSQGYTFARAFRDLQTARGWAAETRARAGLATALGDVLLPTLPGFVFGIAGAAIGEVQASAVDQFLEAWSSFDDSSSPGAAAAERFSIQAPMIERSFAEVSRVAFGSVQGPVGASGDPLLAPILAALSRAEAWQASELRRRETAYQQAVAAANAAAVRAQEQRRAAAAAAAAETERRRQAASAVEAERTRQAAASAAAAAAAAEARRQQQAAEAAAEAEARSARRRGDAADIAAETARLLREAIPQMYPGASFVPQAVPAPRYVTPPSGSRGGLNCAGTYGVAYSCR